MNHRALHQSEITTHQSPINHNHRSEITNHPASTFVHSREDILDSIERLGVVAVIRLQDPSRLRAVIDALAEGGIRALEVTMTVPGAIQLIAEIAPILPEGFLLGAGTVLDADTARRAIDAGAQFVVSPVYRAAVVDEAHRRERPAMPGCFSPTEIQNAWEAGADIVKVFPATSLGPGFFRDVRGPLPQVKLMPTGGVSIENADEWIRAGAVAVGVGSALLDPRAIAAGDYASITEKAKRILANVEDARAGR
jgi:2-dehydro-3-deoxyphosphogluconate aldolase/(4S)-4-hydroxy-2-oxoglutarate aldolase